MFLSSSRVDFPSRGHRQGLLMQQVIDSFHPFQVALHRGLTVIRVER